MPPFRATVSCHAQNQLKADQQPALARGARARRPVTADAWAARSCGWFPEVDARGSHEIRISTDLVMVNPNKGFKWHQVRWRGASAEKGGRESARRRQSESERSVAVDGGR
jgi:hypothetical protein